MSTSPLDARRMLDRCTPEGVPPRTTAPFDSPVRHGIRDRFTLPPRRSAGSVGGFCDFQLLIFSWSPQIVGRSSCPLFRSLLLSSVPPWISAGWPARRKPVSSSPLRPHDRYPTCAQPYLSVDPPRARILISLLVFPAARVQSFPSPFACLASFSQPRRIDGFADCGVLCLAFPTSAHRTFGNSRLRLVLGALFLYAWYRKNAPRDLKQVN